MKMKLVVGESVLAEVELPVGKEMTLGEWEKMVWEARAAVDGAVWKFFNETWADSGGNMILDVNN